jgi:SAM-dependent methyltransferase
MRQDLYEDLYVKEQDYWWHVGKRAIVYSLLRKYLPHNKTCEERNALDLGCGAGLNLDHLSEYARPVGTDFSEEALKFCLARGHNLLAKADAALLPFPDREFDIITALDVIEHLDDDLVALRELKRTMRKGGLLIISVPAYPSLWSYWDDILGHRRRYTVSAMREVVEKAGLRVRKVSYSNTLILAPTVAVRIFKSMRQKAADRGGNGSDPETDFMPVPGIVNSLLVKYYLWEARTLRKRRLPFGLSVVCVAQRVD